jgi:hypothetical protein
MSEERKRPVWLWITIALFVVLVVYPLSIGPYLWLSDVAYSAVVFIDPAYDPLRWIAAQSEASDRAMNKYCSWWRIAKSK